MAYVPRMRHRIKAWGFIPRNHDNPTFKRPEGAQEPRFLGPSRADSPGESGYLGLKAPGYNPSMLRIEIRFRFSRRQSFLSFFLCGKTFDVISRFLSDEKNFLKEYT